MKNVSVYRSKDLMLLVLATRTHQIVVDSRYIEENGREIYSKIHDGENYDLVGRLLPYEEGDILESDTGLPVGSIIKDSDNRILKRHFGAWTNVENGMHTIPAIPATIVRVGY